jgi:hypothetical protein
MVSRGVAIQFFFLFIIDLQNFKRKNQHFKGPIWQKEARDVM